MPILKYKLKGQCIPLSGGAQGGVNGSGAEVDTSLSTAGMAADAKATGEAIASKQNKAYFSSTKPSNWKTGDIWLKPAE